MYIYIYISLISVVIVFYVFKTRNNSGCMLHVTGRPSQWQPVNLTGLRPQIPAIEYQWI